MAEVDNRNGFGFIYDDAAVEQVMPSDYFPSQVSEIRSAASSYGSCLIRGGPGAGKSHLLLEIVATAVNEEQPSFMISPQISGGKKPGAENALHVLNAFVELHGKDGLLVVDNVDYYGYSGSQASRRYSVAQAHVPVARLLTELVSDSQAPTVIGVAHPQQWRDGHWLYRSRRPGDTVTGPAQELLDSFRKQYDFEGIICAATAAALLKEKITGAEDDHILVADAVAEIKALAGELYYRHFNHLELGLYRAVGATAALHAIDQVTTRLSCGADS